MNDHRLMKIILAPVVSEKSTRGVERSDQYTFRVQKDATKPEIKAAIEKLFTVEVRSVKTANLKGKVKRLAMRSGKSGKQANWKKAMVRLQAGQVIDLMNNE